MTMTNKHIKKVKPQAKPVIAELGPNNDCIPIK
jgi:hypothetical protein